MDFTDPTSSVRPGEELNLEALSAYFAKAAPDLAGPLVVEQFPSGHSNLTYMLRAGDRELVLRRPPFGSKVKTAHDMGREFRILSGLHPVYPPAPRPLVFCEDESVMGCKFYVMERIKGVILRRSLPPGMTLPPETADRLCESFIQNLATMHAIDMGQAGLADVGKPDGYLKRQVDGWSERYVGSQTDDIAEINQVIPWLKQNLPASPAPTLVHNDYKYDNIVLDPADITRIIGVLDWEMSTYGDPLTDLGVALGYWVQADDPPELLMSGFGPTHVPGSWTRRRLADRYAEITGRDVSNVRYYTVFATFKIAVIIQQIYFRFVKGHTHDERFAPMLQYVKLLSRVASELIGRDSV